MGQGLRYTDLPAELKRYRDDIFDDKYHRLQWDDLSRSITAHIAKDGYWYIHPEEDRTLTVREAARIQTFPDEFRYAGSRSDAFRLIGNAVPPLLAEVIAKAVREATEHPKPISQRQPSAHHRSEVRRLLLDWASKSPIPAWRRVGAPWAVLIGTLAGRGRQGLADRLLGLFPDPAAATRSRISTLVRKATDDKESRVIQAVGRASHRLQKSTWEDGDWAKASGLGVAETLWVETVGLGRRHVAAATGTVRVAGRVLGEPDAGGVAGRMLLARLIGYSHTAPAVTAAIAGLAIEVCGSAGALCEMCPLSEVCLSAISLRLQCRFSEGLLARGEPAVRQHIRHGVGILVLPDMQRLPTDFTKPSVVTPIPGYVGIELRCPPFAVRLRPYSVLWAGMPEAAIDKDSQLESGQHEIRFSREVPPVKPKANPTCVQSSAQRHLWFRVPGPLTGHKAPDLIRGSGWPVIRLTHSEARK